MNDDDYRKQAAEAQRQADRATNEIDKAAWLHLVAGWLSMIRGAPKTREQLFTDNAGARGTGQERSEESH